MVTNLEGKNGLRTVLTSGSYVIQFCDFTKGSPSYTNLLKVGNAGVDLGNFATVTQLNAANADISNLSSGLTTAKALYATTIRGKYFRTEDYNYNLTAISVNIDGQTYHLLGRKG